MIIFNETNINIFFMWYVEWMIFEVFDCFSQNTLESRFRIIIEIKIIIDMK